MVEVAEPLTVTSFLIFSSPVVRLLVNSASTAVFLSVPALTSTLNSFLPTTAMPLGSLVVSSAM